MCKFESNCDRCRQKIVKNIGQTIIDRQLRFYLACNCPFCNSTLELDDIRFPEEYYRLILLSKQGKYRLQINLEENVDKIATMKAVRQTLQLSIAQLTKLFDSTSIIVLSEGTKAEMEWLQLLLLNAKVRSIVRSV